MAALLGHCPGAAITPIDRDANREAFRARGGDIMSMRKTIRLPEAV